MTCRKRYSSLHISKASSSSTEHLKPSALSSSTRHCKPLASSSSTVQDDFDFRQLCFICGKEADSKKMAHHQITWSTRKID